MKILVLFLTLQFKCFAQEIEGFDSFSFGVHNIEDGYILQGSTDFGGIQPNYDINLSSSLEIKEFIEYSRSLEGLKTKEIIKRLRKKVKTLIPQGDYNGSDYLLKLEEYRETGKPIPLSEYLNCRSGVCRENAIFMHIGLKNAGIESRYVYTQAKSVNFGSVRVEDHAIVIMKDKGRLKIVDSYFSNFNGKYLDQVLGKYKITGIGSMIKINRINNYPRVYIPKNKSSQRSLRFSKKCINYSKAINTSNIDDLIFLNLLKMKMI